MKKVIKILLIVFFIFALFAIIWLKAAIVNMGYEEGEINKIRTELIKEQRLIEEEKKRMSLMKEIKPKRIGIVMPGNESVIYLEDEEKKQVLNILNHRLEKDPNLITKVTKEANKSVILLHGDWTEVFSVIDSQLKKLSDGLIIFNTPEEMVIGKKERISAIIVKNHLIDNKKYNIKHAEKIKINTIMKMTLAGNSFQITPLSHDEQIIMDTEETTWSWDVIPVESSIQSLLLLVSTKLRFHNNEEGIKDYPFIEKNISVKINPRYTLVQVLKNDWQWIINSLIALLGIIISSELIAWLIDRRHV